MPTQATYAKEKVNKIEKRKKELKVKVKLCLNRKWRPIGL
jgi:hypothetical protein